MRGHRGDIEDLHEVGGVRLEAEKTKPIAHPYPIHLSRHLPPQFPVRLEVVSEDRKYRVRVAQPIGRSYEVPDAFDLRDLAGDRNDRPVDRQVEFDAKSFAFGSREEGRRTNGVVDDGGTAFEQFR